MRGPRGQSYCWLKRLPPIMRRRHRSGPKRIPKVTMDEPSKRLAPRRGIYILPNLLTTAALFAGFYAVVAAIDGRFWRAAVAIFVALLFDGLDGRVARTTHTESAFG